MGMIASLTDLGCQTNLTLWQEVFMLVLLKDTTVTNLFQMIQHFSDLRKQLLKMLAVFV
jgi:hypothetical protein